MGAFFLSPGPGSRSSAAERVLADQGFARPQVLSTDAFELVVYPSHVEETASVLRLPDGDFAASTGTFVLGSQRDHAALPAAYERFRGDVRVLDDALGAFTLLVYAGGVLHITADAVGSAPVYLDSRSGFVSSSFLALAAALPGLTLVEQSVYELVLNSTVKGDATLVREIDRLPRRAVYRLDQGRGSVIPTPPELPRKDARRRPELLAEADAMLDDEIGRIAEAFDGRTSCGLTSGYDSRLVFALARRRGLTPRTLTYRAVGHKSITVAVASEVAAADGLELEIIERGDLPIPGPDDMPAVVAKNMLFADGWIYHGFFVHPVDFEYAADRSPRGTVYLHGGGGEIFRNFFQLPDRPFSARDVVRSFYLKWDRRVCSGRFDTDRYVDGIADKIHSLTGTSGGKLDRQTIEWLFPAFRVRGWGGRENALYARTGASMMPYVEYRLQQFATTIPLAYKATGTFQADLIKRARPSVAAVRSQYGHDFATAPPLKRRLLDLAKTSLPVDARPPPYTVLNRRRAKRQTPGPWLTEANVRAVLPDGVVRVAPLFDLDQPMDRQMRARVLSVEALAQHWGTKLATEWGA